MNKEDAHKMLNKERISFTKYERTCKFHVQRDDKICYCKITDDYCNCSKYNCPQYKEEDENVP